MTPEKGLPSGNGRAPSVQREDVDVVIVGARLAGCATAIPLASSGRSVVLLDRMGFPSNIPSTHGFLPAHVREVQRLGFLDKVLSHEPPLCRMLLFGDGHGELRMPTIPYEGIDFGFSMARPEVDSLIQERARELGAEIRDRSPVTDVVRRNGRVVGVRYTDPKSKSTKEITAKLVVGADGYWGSMPKLLGVQRPFRSSHNERGVFYWFLKDPKMGTIWRHTLAIWRIGRLQGLVMPMPRGMMSVQWLPPIEDIPACRRDPLGMWEHFMAQNRRMADRVTGAQVLPEELVRDHLPQHGWMAIDEFTSYFRVASGPGWALPGDAGHCKDPLIGQGMRDALRYGRLLGDATAEVLDDPRRLDEALRAWDQRRYRECRSAYHWGNLATRFDLNLDPLFRGLIDVLKDVERPKSLSGVFSRLYPFWEGISKRDVLVGLAHALKTPGVDRRQVLHAALNEILIECDVRTETARGGGWRHAHRGRSEHPPRTSLTPAFSPAYSDTRATR